jgi:hypothetical protein
MSTRSICHAAAAAAVVQAGDCPLLREPRIPPVPEPVDLVDPINIDKVKTQLRDYHAGNYDHDAAAVLSDARIYVERRLKSRCRRGCPKWRGRSILPGLLGGSLGRAAWSTYRRHFSLCAIPSASNTLSAAHCHIRA